ncbi:ABC transporter permease [Arthrobacter sp. H14]|uniref:ABC transporter permease n=1 Tax=Arthrobacter sp. H14 TaxID=1312959 RepID=UPI00047ECA24|nr:ABC transporter permease [Arthrobacter sp. H14]
MSVADFAAENNLHRVGARPPLHKYLQEMWQRRDFAIAMARYKIEADNQKNRLGMIWIGLSPVLTAIVYGVVFGLLQGDRRPDNFASFIIVGVFLFQYFTNTMNSGAKSIVSNRSLVQSLAFPRMTLPMATVIQQLMNVVVIIGVMYVILLVLGNPPSLSWLLIVPLVMIMTVFNAGVALFTARLTAHTRDLTQVLPIVTRIFFYTSGVLFPIDRVLSHFPALVKVYDFHPIYEFLVIGRGVLLEGYEVPAEYWLYASAWALLLLVIGTVTFWAAEESYGRVD